MKHSRLISLFSIIFFLLVLPLTIFIAQQQQEYRQHAATSPIGPSGEAMPIGDLPGWHQIFTDDFTTNVPLGNFPSAVSTKWDAYPDGWKDTSKNGTYYPSKVISIQNGIMNLYLHTENGVHMVSAPEPKLPSGTGSQGGLLYGRYVIRFRSDPVPGYKSAWLLWPDSETWPRDGEIDFPEGDLGSTIGAYMHRQNGTSGGDQDSFSSSYTYTSWHTAILEWSPTKTNFILDGNTIGSSTNRIPNTPMHWVIQTETALNGTPPSNTAAGNVQIDWVAVYTPSNATNTPTPSPTTIPPTQTAQSVNPSGNPRFGISGHLVGLSTADLNKSLDDYKALGVQWVRDDFEWPSMQPNNTNNYDWTTHDAFVTAANARGIKVLGIIDYTPQWELPAGCTDLYQCPPKNNADYANFAATLVKHYAPMGVHTWELWNEPNGGTFTTANYTALIKATYPAIKNADPTAFVLAGSTEPTATSGKSYAPTDFLSGIYQNGGKAYFDGVSHHPYCYGGTSNSFNCPKSYADWSAWSQMQDTNPSLRSIMIANGDQNKKIWATEFGAPTGGTSNDAKPVNEAQQAQMVQDGYNLFNSYTWAGPLFWYTYIDSCTTTSDIECYFGLVHTNYSPKPAYTIYKNITASITSPTATAIPTSLPNPTITPTPSVTTLALNLLLQGIGNGGDRINPKATGNSNPKHQQRTITLLLYNNQNTLIATLQPTITYDPNAGTFKGIAQIATALPSGAYTIKIKINQYLQTQIPGIQNLTTGQTNNLPPIALIAGNLNGDNQINIADYNMLMGCYSDLLPATNCTTAANTLSDLNDDGQVNSLDYNLFLRELSSSSGQ